MNTVTTRRRWVAQSKRGCGDLADSLRDDAARLVRETFPRARKTYKPVTAWALSRARKEGGPFAQLVDYMLSADPVDVMKLAGWVDSAAVVILSERSAADLEALNMEAARANADDAVAAVMLEAHPDCKDTLMEVERRKERDIAADRLVLVETRKRRIALEQLETRP